MASGAGAGGGIIDVVSVTIFALTDKGCSDRSSWHSFKPACSKTKLYEVHVTVYHAKYFQRAGWKKPRPLFLQEPFRVLAEYQFPMLYRRFNSLGDLEFVKSC
jgi:hypothetical protein